MSKPTNFRLGRKTYQRITPISGQRPPLPFRPSHPIPPIITLVRRLTPAYVRLAGQIGGLEIEQTERLEEALRDFYAGRTRLVLAYRHPSTDDPPLIYKAITHNLYHQLQRQGRPLPVAPHLYFLYDRGIPLWGGKLLGLGIPLLGGTPILRGQADRPGLAAARRLLAFGAHPFAIAPEGGTNRLNGRLGKLEDGVVQMAAWAQEDLQKSGEKALPVVILPLGLSYSYCQTSWSRLDDLLDQLEEGLRGDETAPEQPTDHRLAQLTDPQLRRAAGRYLGLHSLMLDKLEKHYRPYVREELALPSSDLDERTAHLTDLIFRLVEERLQVSRRGHGHFRDRLYRGENAAWERIYRPAPTSPLEQGLADLVAREAAQAGDQLRIAEFLIALRLDYFWEKPSFERLSELALLSWEVLARCLTLRYGQRPRLGLRHAHLSVGQPLRLEPPAVQSDRAARKTAIAQTQHALREELGRLVASSNL